MGRGNKKTLPACIIIIIHFASKEKRQLFEKYFEKPLFSHVYVGGAGGVGASRKKNALAGPPRSPHTEHAEQASGSPPLLFSLR